MHINKDFADDSDGPTRKKESIVKVPEVKSPAVKEETCCDKLYGYGLLLWDGLGFFGFATSKLERLRGEKVTFLTPLTNVQFVLMNLILGGAAIAIVLTEVAKLNTQKSQTIDLEQQTTYSWVARDALSLIIGHWFYTDEIFAHIRKYQDETRADPKAIKHVTRPQGLIPTSYDKFDFYDRKFVEDYMCARLKTKFKAQERFDAIGTVAWDEIVEWYFKCEFMHVVNDKIRIRFWLPYTDVDARLNYTNTSPYGAGKQTMTDDELQRVFFKKSTSFKAQLVMDYDNDLKGLTSYSYALHTKEAADVTKYNNWNFTTSRIWDSVEEGFWFANETTVLWHTVNHKVGIE